jgi:hypothetical protein
MMWGTSIIGFGSYDYKYASGHEGDSALTGFAARGRPIVVYIAPLAQCLGFFEELLCAMLIDLRRRWEFIPSRAEFTAPSARRTLVRSPRQR